MYRTSLSPSSGKVRAALVGFLLFMLLVTLVSCSNNGEKGQEIKLNTSLAKVETNAKYSKIQNKDFVPYK